MAIRKYDSLRLEIEKFENPSNIFEIRSYQTNRDSNSNAKSHSTSEGNMKFFTSSTDIPDTSGADRVRTAKGFISAAAFLSFLLSVSLWFSGDRETGLFVGIWVSSILSAGTLMLSRGHDG